MSGIVQHNGGNNYTFVFLDNSTAVAVLNGTTFTLSYVGNVLTFTRI